MKLQRFPDHKLESYQDKQSVDFSDIERMDKEVSQNGDTRIQMSSVPSKV